MEIKKQSKQKLSVIQRDLWQHCRRIQGVRLAKPDGSVDCYTCGAINLQGSNRQLGHVPWPKATLSAFLKYDFRLLRWQCFRCNINFSGLGGVAYPKMEKEFGKEFMEQLERDRLISVKASDFYLELLEKYSKIDS